MIRFGILLSFLLIFSASMAQNDKTKVRFYVKGSSQFFIRLNGELLPTSNIQNIAPGTHAIEIWSPMHKLYKGKLEIPDKDSISYYQELERDEAYVDYLFAHDNYKRDIFLGRTAPLFLAGVGAISAPILFVARKNAHEAFVIQEFKSNYFSADEATKTLQQRYAVVNGLFFTSIGLAVGGAAVHLLLKKKIKNLKKPVYKQQNPFTLETFELSFNPVTNGPQAGLTLSF